MLLYLDHSFRDPYVMLMVVVYRSFVFCDLGLFFFFFLNFDRPYDHTLLVFKLEMDEYRKGN